jgi:hypothetical protein
MSGMDEFICIPTENIPMPKMHDHHKCDSGCVMFGCSVLAKADRETWTWDKNLDDFQALANNLRSEGQESRAIAVEYLIERCKRLENIQKGEKDV